MDEKQLTAVEWFYNELKNLIRQSELTDMKPSEFDERELELINQAKEMEKELTLKLCYGVWRAAKSGANYIYITKDSALLGYVEPLSEGDRLNIDVELFIAIKPI